MEIAPAVHALTGFVVNLYLLVEPDGLTLIDAGLSGDQRKVLKAIAGLGRQPSDLKRILITHSDGDHVGALAAIKAATGARAYASPIEAQATAAGHASRMLKLSGLVRLAYQWVSPLFKARPATIDEHLAGGSVLPVLGGLQVLETPGHTPGHLSFWLPSAGVLFTGDSIVAYGGKLTMSSGANTWDVDKARESARAQARLGARIVAPGHGAIVRAPVFPEF